MAKASRKDKRGYVLKTGECQRPDGRYSYSYTDRGGERHVVYANDLAELRKKERKVISVNHNITDAPYEDGTCVKHIQTPKTKAGERTIPMIDEVFEAFLQEYEIQKCMGCQSETIDGYTNFVFLTTGGSVITAASVNWVMHLIIDSYNEKETKKAKEEMREPVLLPNFSAHNLRGKIIF